MAQIEFSDDTEEDLEVTKIVRRDLESIKKEKTELEGKERYLLALNRFIIYGMATRRDNTYLIKCPGPIFHQVVDSTDNKGRHHVKEFRKLHRRTYDWHNTAITLKHFNKELFLPGARIGELTVAEYFSEIFPNDVKTDYFSSK